MASGGWVSSQRARALTCGTSLNSEARLGAFQAFCSRFCKVGWNRRGETGETVAAQGIATLNIKSATRRSLPETSFATAFILALSANERPPVGTMTVNVFNSLHLL